jgi:LysR family pca operon transcriptional activator
MGPVGLTMRADAAPSLPLSLLMQTIREVAGTIVPRLRDATGRASLAP